MVLFALSYVLALAHGDVGVLPEADFHQDLANDVFDARGFFPSTVPRDRELASTSRWSFRRFTMALRFLILL
jgi:hypothetical protein